MVKNQALSQTLNNHMQSLKSRMAHKRHRCRMEVVISDPDSGFKGLEMFWLCAFFNPEQPASHFGSFFVSIQYSLVHQE